VVRFASAAFNQRHFIPGKYHHSKKEKTLLIPKAALFEDNKVLVKKRKKY